MARIWRTVDGRHVPDGHPDAAVLAYGDSDEPPAEVLAELAGKPHPKARRKPADKAMPRPDDKGKTTESGLSIKRLADAGDDAT